MNKFGVPKVETFYVCLLMKLIFVFEGYNLRIRMSYSKAVCNFKVFI
jgi:hypothetical protein